MPAVTEDDDRSDRLFEMLDGFAISQIAAAAAQLGAWDHLAAGPLTADQLAGLTGTQVEPLRRLVHAWCLLGLLTPADDRGRYRAAPLLELLGTGAPGSLTGMARLYGQEYYRAWGELLHTVRTGESGFERFHRTSLWKHLAGNDGAAQAFAHAMTFNVMRHIPRILESFDFSTAKLVVDVGAANGELLAAILARHPALRGIAFDLPRVADRSGTVFEDRGLAQRCEVVTGDFFETVPRGGDLYVLKAVLHNWDDERAVRILENCRAAMAPGGRLLVIESPRSDASDDLGLVLKDLWMMVLFGGRDRTTPEYVSLIERAGFAHAEVVPGPGSPALIQATNILLP